MVDPLVLGRKKLEGEPLSGNLDKIAKFQLAFRKEAVEASKLGGEGVARILQGRSSNDISVLGTAKRTIQGSLGRPAKTFLLSDAVQGGLTNPREVQNFSSALARYVSEQFGNEVAEAADSAP